MPNKNREFRGQKQSCNFLIQNDFFLGLMHARLVINHLQCAVRVALSSMEALKQKLPSIKLDISHCDHIQGLVVSQPVKII